MRKRAETAVRRAGARLGRAVDAVIRFEQDGPVKRVEIVMHAPPKRDLVSLGESRFYGIALKHALGRLNAQVRTLREMTKTSARARTARVAAEA
jgi:hypothetical protein